MTTRNFLDRYDCIEVGDWVRFMSGGELTIGEVEYIVDSWPPRHVTFYTTAGSTSAEAILETRRAGERHEPK